MTGTACGALLPRTWLLVTHAGPHFVLPSHARPKCVRYLRGILPLGGHDPTCCRSRISRLPRYLVSFRDFQQFESVAAAERATRQPFGLATSALNGNQCWWQAHGHVRTPQ